MDERHSWLIKVEYEDGALEYKCTDYDEVCEMVGRLMLDTIAKTFIIYRDGEEYRHYEEKS